MEKGFNDDELADIMNEIESLEKEFTEEVTASAEDVVAEEVKDDPVEEVVATETVETPAAEVVTAEADHALEEVVAEIAEEVVAEHVEEATVEHVEAKVEEVPVAEVEEVAAVATEDPVMHVAEETHSEVEMTQPVEVDGEMEEVLSELAEMPVEEVVAKHDPVDDNVHHMPTHSHTTPAPAAKAPATTGGQSAMSFTVEGDMKLDLSFNISGKIVHLNINENGFELELDGGMKFSIPLEEVKSGKKAA